MKKEEKKEKRPYITIEDVMKEGNSKYETILKIAEEIKRRFELSEERDDSMIYKVIEEFKKGEKDSSGSNR